MINSETASACESLKYFWPVVVFAASLVPLLLFGPLSLYLYCSFDQFNFRRFRTILSGGTASGSFHGSFWFPWSLFPHLWSVSSNSEPYRRILLPAWFWFSPIENTFCAPAWNGPRDQCAHYYRSCSVFLPLFPDATAANSFIQLYIFFPAIPKWYSPGEFKEPFTESVCTACNRSGAGISSSSSRPVSKRNRHSRPIS